MGGGLTQASSVLVRRHTELGQVGWLSLVRSRNTVREAVSKSSSPGHSGLIVIGLLVGLWKTTGSLRIKSLYT